MSTRRLVQNTIQSNLAIQNALTAQATRLETRLKDLDHLIDGITKGEDLPDEPSQAEFQVPGSKRANAPVSSLELLAPSSPLFKEASQRAHYVRWTSHHPMKGKEAEVLADAVKKENMRLDAYRIRDNPAATPINIETNVQGISWSIVAEKVSDHAPIKRTPDECRIQWVAKLHPTVNHGEWTQDELRKLHDLAATALATGQNPNWSKIAKDLGTNRIPIDCMKQATNRPRHHWDANTDQKLLEAVQTFGTNNWNLVARHVSPYATTSQCQTRYVRSLNPSIKHEPWTAEEDTRLRKAVDAFNNTWIDVACVLPGRTNEQCRERWAEIGTTESGKGPWSEVEEQQLLVAVEELGKKWKLVSEKIGSGRTGPNCRLRYRRLMKKQAKQENCRSSATSPAQPAPMIQISTPPTDPGSDNNESKTRGKSNSLTSTEGWEDDERPIGLPSQLGTPSQPDVLILASSKPRPRPRPLRRPDDCQPTQSQMLQAALTRSGSKDGPSLEILHESDHVSSLPTQPQSTAALKGSEEPKVASASGSSSTRGSVQPRTHPERDKKVSERTRGKRKRAESEPVNSNADGVGDGLWPPSQHFQRTSSKRRKTVPAEIVRDGVDENSTTTSESRLDDGAGEADLSITKTAVRTRGGVRGKTFKGGHERNKDHPSVIDQE